MAKFRLRFFFDWGSGVCLWADNKEAEEKYDYPVDASLLPISDELKKELNHLIDNHDDALNWDDPRGGLLWSREQIEQFILRARDIYSRLCDELGSDYEIVFEENLII